MQYSLFDEIKNYSLQHRKKVVLFLCLIILSIFGIVMNVSFANKLDNSKSFDEIQNFVDEVKEKDKDIYNTLESEEIQKTVKGIDVSSWQGDIDWAKVKASGIDFVMIRCGFRNLSNSDMLVDKKFHYNISQANYYDIPVGVYFYSTATNQREVLEEATFVLNLIKDYEITYPVAYDFESFFQNRVKDVSLNKINYNALFFLDYMRSHGYQGMLYTNLTASSYWDLDRFSNYKVWFAHYIDKTNYTGKYDMWQYADNGRIDGIKGYVDMNEAYFAYEVRE